MNLPLKCDGETVETGLVVPSGLGALTEDGGREKGSNFKVWWRFGETRKTLTPHTLSNWLVWGEAEGDSRIK